MNIRTPLEAARIRAARLYPWRSVCRRAIRNGEWDRGLIVRQFIAAT